MLKTLLVFIRDAKTKKFLFSTFLKICYGHRFFYRNLLRIFAICSRGILLYSRLQSNFPQLMKLAHNKRSFPNGSRFKRSSWFSLLVVRVISALHLWSNQLEGWSVSKFLHHIPRKDWATGLTTCTLGSPVHHKVLMLVLKYIVIMLP